ncbi:DUF4184 family protein [Pontibacter sp. JH31]|uniref:DUF4184 family protein n=1 Tax=Pontibacter aquaedesilientis TaxID=2766980 RepID=A0ABR7XJE4_9BACT|nr:DUF4184 family protein [Pontibacter aquaedesilientis]MBD1398437.1 DUF4184 family protein [Pontibacter aquaedesilientis]
MPFTAAHPAAILPLLRRSRWFSATGLITGSIAPDFQYFFLLPLFRHSGHTLEGLLYFNLPVAFVLAMVFHVIVRRPVVAHLPTWLQSRALAVPRLSWISYMRERWLVFATSVIIGASTHIFWDGFTHYGGYFVQQWPALTRTTTILGMEMMYCRILQHTSTLVGSLAILLYTWQLPAVAIPDGMGLRRKFWFWTGIGVAGFGFMVFALFASAFMRSLMGIVVSFLSGAMLATLALSIALQISRYRQRA